MPIEWTAYQEQSSAWPASGRHILAQYEGESVVVYQAYRAAIGHYAAAHGQFGGDFSYSRMSWTKPNFLWMMYRSGWGTKPDQEVTLAVRLRREFFDRLLAAAVPSTFDPDLYRDPSEWMAAVAASDVRLQWDPDHSPSGQSLPRRAIQLGLRGAALQEYGQPAVLEIENISDLVAEQRRSALCEDRGGLRTPAERVYVPTSPETAARLKLDTPG